MIGRALISFRCYRAACANLISMFWILSFPRVGGFVQ